MYVRRRSKNNSKNDVNYVSNLKKKSRFEIFCSCLSVRGIPKLCVGPSVLRLAWFIFLLCMTSFLITSTTLLILDYLNYDVTVNSIIKLDDQSPFPSITVCRHDPYTKDSYEKWNKKASKVRSPQEFSQHLNDIVNKVIETNDPKNGFLLWFRKQNVYYQSLKYEEALSISYNLSAYYGCIYTKSDTVFYENDCSKLLGYRVKTYSDTSFFNCHTFEPKESDRGEIERFGLIANLNSKLDSIDQRQLFVDDVFEQATGLLVAIHEPGTLPNMEQDGIHIEPGKMNEINYEISRREHLNTPTKPCINDTSERSIVDLGQYYNYTETTCLLNEVQREIMKDCKCIYAMYPRAMIPNEELPYCGNIDINFDAMHERLSCLVTKLKYEVKEAYKLNKKCVPKCTYHSYGVTTSVTKWRAHHWQLYWLKHLNGVLSSFDFINNKETIKEFRKYSDAQDLPKSLPEDSILDLDGENFAYVLVKRKSNDTIVKKDRLVLSMAVLLSRIGGLCSLTIGLTAAVVVELVEFIFFMFKLSQNESRENDIKDETKDSVTSRTLNDTLHERDLQNCENKDSAGRNICQSII